MDQDATIQKIVQSIPDSKAGQRFVIAIAGPPASGKSTIAKELFDVVGERACILGLDAFHFDDQILLDRGDRPRKGAHFTFDVCAYKHTLQMLRTDTNSSVSVPVFDRSYELSRNCAHMIEPHQDVLITEGNYLLLSSDPWSELSDLFDLTVRLDEPIEVLESRLMQRWFDNGYEEEEARFKVKQNDLLNAEYVKKESASANIEP